MAGDKQILEGFVGVSGRDKETFGSDEFIRDARHEVRVIMARIDDAVRLNVPPFKWGGECRVEARLEAISNVNGTVQVFGQLIFFEGDSENTPNERDREIVNVLVPARSTSFPHPMVVGAHLQNGEGDFADVRLSLTNTTISAGGEL